MRLLCSALLIGVVLSRVDACPDEQKLRETLMMTYPGPLVRPVKNNADNVTVIHGLSLQDFEFDSTKRLFNGHFWINMEWKDHGLVWNPEDYGGLSSIRMRRQDVWIPDVIPYNNYKTGAEEMTETLLVVYSDGQLNWVPPVHYTVLCSEKFQCTIKFGSWTYDGNNIDLQEKSDDVDVATFSENDDWELTSAEATRHKIYYACCSEPYIDIAYTFVLNSKK